MFSSEQRVHDQTRVSPRQCAEEFDIDSQVPDPTGMSASFKHKFKYLAPINRVTEKHDLSSYSRATYALA